jgi:hypothetical protein
MVQEYKVCDNLSISVNIMAIYYEHYFMLGSAQKIILQQLVKVAFLRTKPSMLGGTKWMHICIEMM